MDDLVYERIGCRVRLACRELIRAKGVKAERNGRAMEAEPRRSEVNISDKSIAIPAFVKKV